MSKKIVVIVPNTVHGIMYSVVAKNAMVGYHQYSGTIFVEGEIDYDVLQKQAIRLASGEIDLVQVIGFNVKPQIWKDIDFSDVGLVYDNRVNSKIEYYYGDENFRLVVTAKTCGTNWKEPFNPEVPMHRNSLNVYMQSNSFRKCGFVKQYKTNITKENIHSLDINGVGSFFASLIMADMQPNVVEPEWNLLNLLLAQYASSSVFDYRIRKHGLIPTGPIFLKDTRVIDLLNFPIPKIYANLFQHSYGISDVLDWSVGESEEEIEEDDREKYIDIVDALLEYEEDEV